MPSHHVVMPMTQNIEQLMTLLLSSIDVLRPNVFVKEILICCFLAGELI